MGKAVISACGLYRYRLERRLRDDDGPTVAFIMVNPSTADAEQDDATIRKCIVFAKTLGAAELIVGNKFAFRATDIKALRSAPDPVGPLNDQHVAQILYDSDIAIVAWGALAKLPETLRGRWKEIVRMADAVRRSGPCDLFAIGMNADGHPRHPLMTGYDTPIAKWTVPWFANRTTAKVSPHGVMKLTEAQRDAIGWLNPDGSQRLWSGRDAGHPSIAALDALVRKDLATKRGGDGFPVRYGITPAGRALLASSGKTEK